MTAHRLSVALNVIFAALLAGGAGFWLWRRSAAGGVDAFWTERHIQARADLFERLEAKPGGIVLLGDSLTERGEWRELLERDDILNRGIAGDTARGARSRLDPVIRARPRLVVIMLGINDLEAGRAPADVAADIDEIVIVLRQRLPDVRIVLQGVLPMRDVGRGLGVSLQAVDDLDARIASLAKRHRATFVDVRSQLVDSSGQLSAATTQDGVHLNGAGYALWAAALAEHLH
jgi:lysophospholipase L1-like esterase